MDVSIQRRKKASKACSRATKVIIVRNMQDGLFSNGFKDREPIECSKLAVGDIIATVNVLDSAKVLDVRTTNGVTTVKYTTEAYPGYIESTYNESFKLLRINRVFVN